MDTYKQVAEWKDEIETLTEERERLYWALETLERVSGTGLMTDDPARIKAREVLEDLRGDFYEDEEAEEEEE